MVRYNKAEFCPTSGVRKFYLFAFILWIGILLTPSVSLSGDVLNENETLDVKIGQMIMIGFRGLSVDDTSPVIADIQKRNIGGIILFDYDVPSGSPVRNIESPDQVKSLVRALQRASSIPLFIAIDQEGGRVSRLKEQFGFSTNGLGGISREDR